MTYISIKKNSYTYTLQEVQKVIKKKFNKRQDTKIYKNDMCEKLL